MHLFLELPDLSRTRTRLRPGDEISIHRPEALEPYMSLLRRRKRKSSHVIFWSNGDNKLLVGNTARASILARVISEVTGFVLEETATTPHRSVYTLRQRPNVYIVQQRKLSKKTRSKKSRKRKPLGKK